MISEFILATILTTALTVISITLNKQLNEIANINNFINSKLEPPIT